MRTNTNIFLTIAEVMWKRGEDGEDIARELSNALEWIIKEGKGNDCNVDAEFNRLRNIVRSSMIEALK